MLQFLLFRRGLGIVARVHPRTFNLDFSPLFKCVLILLWFVFTFRRGLGIVARAPLTFLINLDFSNICPRPYIIFAVD